MNVIKVIMDFRQEFGLSQHELAKLMNVSRSGIALIEKGLRSVPMDVQMGLFEIMHQLDTEHATKKQSGKFVEPVNRPGKEVLFDELAGRFAEVQFALSAVTKKIKAAVERYRQITETDMKLLALIAVLPTGSDKAELVERKKLARLNELTSCDEVAQLRLQVQKDLLSAEANVISQYLGNGVS